MIESVRQSGIELHPETEPVHLLFKWSADREPRTIDRHRAVADRAGSVWWGKFGSTDSAAMSTKNISDMQAQLDAGFETYVYLYRPGEVWRTRLLELTTDPHRVDVELLPDYYSPDECNLFVRVEGFSELEPNWPTSHLVLASNPDPVKIAGALANQTTPLRVYELFSESLETTPRPDSELTIEWLVGETLWSEESLVEVADTLLGSNPQVVLAGPPGTGKTWVAKHIARYLTQDKPLAHRIVQLHPSYGYEEFIEGLRPVADAGAIRFQRVDGVVLKMAKAIEEDEETHVLVIDEMNRANLPRVFGELMYLFEYRSEPIDLQYSEDFTLPPGLKFIGTMNTADRSIRSIDVALRRRFEVFECFPDVEVLRRFYDHPDRVNEVESLFSGFEDLNAELNSRLDRHHTIGHTFFMAERFTDERLGQVWKRKIGPLIEEYFFDQPDIAEEFTLGRFWKLP